MEEPEGGEAVGIFLGKGESNIAAHAMTDHDAFVDVQVVEEGLDRGGEVFYGGGGDDL
jgi:hypothetical protein